MNARKLSLSFYLRPTLTVAKDLLGKILIRKVRGKIISGMIVETEGYLGEKDPASHAYRGKTKRNEVMFGRGGHLYVYFTYGMHYCSNVVTEEGGKARAVLLRAVEPLSGIGIMEKNRGPKFDESGPVKLTNGPAKLCEAFGFGRETNGADLLGSEVYIAVGSPVPRNRIVTTTRIGVNNGREKKWRFYISGNKYVSRP